MKSTKTAPRTTPEDSPETKIRQMIALSLCVESVSDSDPLDRFESIDLVEAVVTCERSLGLSEIDDDKLLSCKTIEDLVKIINGMEVQCSNQREERRGRVDTDAA